MDYSKTICCWYKVLFYDSQLHLFARKLQSRWVGPYTVHKVYPYRAVEIQDPKDGSISMVNGQQLKPFIEGFDTLLVSIPLKDPKIGDE